MQLLWIQYWTALPVIVEDKDMSDGSQMGPRIPPGTFPTDSSTQYRPSESEGNTPNEAGSQAAYDFPSQTNPSQLQFLSGQPYPGFGQNVPHFTGQAQPSGAFSMLGMAGALPDYQNPRSSQEGQQSQQPPQFSGQPAAMGSHYPQMPTQYQAPYQHAAAPGYGQTHPMRHPQPTSSIPSPGAFAGNPYYPGAQPQAFSYYPGQYGSMGQPQQGPQGYQSAYPTPYGRASGQAYGQGIPMSYGYGSAVPPLKPGGGPPGRAHPNVSSGVIPSSPRGPPRKPKQSGHALWVGNLPSGARVSDLKDHFSRDATKDIESVFLISKSNCAFVNYRTDAACAAAMTRFHDSRFQGVRLVCRLRRSSTATSTTGAPLGPAALMPSIVQSQSAFEAISQNREVSTRAEEMAKAERTQDGEAPAKQTDKYFIMKSLTVEDMELSVRNNIWATQAHNEEALNKAFETTENVYLVFSANKSGEYFGVARMASPINEEAAKDLEWAPRAETVVDDPDVPRSMSTSATEFAPRGRIIDDSARGTIFWEADLEDQIRAHESDSDAEDEAEVKTEGSVESTEEHHMTPGAQGYGKPFRIQWLSNNRLPFYRTRGLRNPWNANREVKIARDGTELETSVGRRLIHMFQKTSTTSEAPMPMPWPPSRSI